MSLVSLRPSWLPFALAASACIAAAAAGLWELRSDTAFRQGVRVLVHDAAFWSSRRLLLVGDSRVDALRCGDKLPGWRILNLGMRGLTARELKSELGGWIGDARRFERAVVWIGCRWRRCCVKVFDCCHRG